MQRYVFNGVIDIQPNSVNTAIITKDNLAVTMDDYYIAFCNVHQRYKDTVSSFNAGIDIAYEINNGNNQVLVSFYNNTSVARSIAYQIEALVF